MHRCNVNYNRRPLEWTHLPEEFHVHFGDTVDGPGSLYGDIRGGVSGGGGAKCSDSAGAE